MSTLDGVWPKASRNNLYFMNTPNRGGEAGTQGHRTVGDRGQS